MRRRPAKLGVTPAHVGCIWTAYWAATRRIASRRKFFLCRRPCQGRPGRLAPGAADRDGPAADRGGPACLRPAERDGVAGRTAGGVTTAITVIKIDPAAHVPKQWQRARSGAPARDEDQKMSDDDKPVLALRPMDRDLSGPYLLGGSLPITYASSGGATVQNKPTRPWWRPWCRTCSLSRSRHRFPTPFNDWSIRSTSSWSSSGHTWNWVLSHKVRVIAEIETNKPVIFSGLVFGRRNRKPSLRQNRRQSSGSGWGQTRGSTH